MDIRLKFNIEVRKAKEQNKKKNPLKFSGLFSIFVGTVGLEPTTPAL